jgi:hypothetical protein
MSSAPTLQHTILPAALRERILSLERPANVQSEGALPITRSACEGAIALLERALARIPDLPLPAVSPSVRGAVALFWEHQGFRLMVQVDSGDLDRLRFQWATPDRQVKQGEEAAEQVIERLLSMTQVA